MEVNESDLSLSEISNLKERTRIRKNHLLVGKMDHSHAVSILGPGRTQEQITSMMLTLDTQKRDLNGFARMEIKKRMVECAMMAQMQCRNKRVRSFDDILKSWANDHSMENAAKVFRIMYGDYDDNPDWLANMEKQFMNKMRWVYYSAEDEPCDILEMDVNGKGCVQMLITRVRIQLLKAINKASARTHGKIIRISRHSAEINDKNRYEKRDKGKFKNRYVHDTHGHEVVDIDIDESSQNEELHDQPGNDIRRSPAIDRHLAIARKNVDTEIKLRQEMAKSTEMRRELNRIVDERKDNATKLQRLQDRETIKHVQMRENAKQKATKRKKTNVPRVEENYQKSEYELQREQRCIRNQARLEFLGLAGTWEEMMGPKKKAKRVIKNNYEESESDESNAGHKPNDDKENKVNTRTKHIINNYYDDNSDSDESNADKSLQDAKDLNKINVSDNCRVDDKASYLQLVGDSMIDIIGHKIEANDIKFQMKWDNGFISWEPMKYVLQDVRPLVIRYVKSNELKDLQVIVGKRKSSNAKTQGEVPKKAKVACTSNHDDLQLGTGYMDESNGAYWKAGCDMHNVDCAKCGAKFVSQGKDIKGVQFKPDTKRPAMVCVNRHKLECKHAICYSCFETGNANITEGPSRRKTRQR